jgi:1-acyl-sn-glycerol-3-phosphate acyltransferase
MASILQKLHRVLVVSSGARIHTCRKTQQSSHPKVHPAGAVQHSSATAFQQRNVVRSRQVPGLIAQHRSPSYSKRRMGSFRFAPDPLSKRYDAGRPMTDPVKAEKMLLAPITGSAMFQAFCRMFFNRYCRLTVARRDHLPAPPFIICSNHTSHVDSAVLMTASGLPFSAFALLGASDYFFDSWSARLLVSRFMNVIPIDRQAQPKSLRRSLAMCAEFLQRTQGNLILYPEGARSCDGKIQTFKRGAGLFAVDLGVPVVPAHIEGAHNILAKGKFMPRPGPVTVRFGEPMAFESNRFDPLRRRAFRRAAIELLEQRIRDLSQSPHPGDLIRQPEEPQEERATIPIPCSAGRPVHKKSPAQL